MFEIGNVVMHPSAGVCNIEDIREEKLTEKKRTYYIMHPISDQNRSTIYVPVDTDKVHLRKLLNEDEIISLIKHSTEEKVEWIDNTNLRKAAYSNIVHSDNISKIIALIAMLHRKRERIVEIGKKFPASDERMLHDAERKIHQEFSHALSIQEEEVPAFILSRLPNLTV